jgi:competence protein ComEA
LARDLVSISGKRTGGSCHEKTAVDRDTFNQPHFIEKEANMKKLLVVLALFGLILGMNAPLWAEDGAKININTAGVEELTGLKNVGVKTAERIVAYRQANGPFQSPQELVNVKGIGEKIVARNQDRVTVD